MSNSSRIVPDVSAENWHRVWDFDADLQAGKTPDPAAAAAGAEGGEEANVLLYCLWQEALFRLESGRQPDLTPAAFADRYPGVAPGLVERVIRQAREEAETADPPASRHPTTVTWVAGPPPIIPNHEILGELGRGGGGFVYKARHLRLDRLVALKVLRADRPLGDAEQFWREARAVASVDHPNVVRVYEVGEVGEAAARPYLSMEFCAGTSLDKICDAPLPPRRAAAVLELVACGVQAAHEKGLVHRDLKPANVLLSGPTGPAPATELLPWGVPKVADFGLARRLDEQGHTGTELIHGTPPFMAPEQAAGGKVGPAADIYGLGAILYACLTGAPPFRGTNILETLYMVRYHDLVPVQRLAPQTPRDLSVICEKCLEKNPGHRYPSAAALAEDLRRFLDHKPIIGRPPSLRRRGGRLLVKYQRPVALAAVLCLAGVAALAWAFWAKNQHEYDLLQAEKKKVDETVGERDRALLEKEDALYVARINRALLACEARNFSQARALLRECPPEPRRWEWGYLNQLAEGRVVKAHARTVTDLAFSPDGTAFVTAGEDGWVKGWDRVNGTELWAVDRRALGPISGLALLPAPPDARWPDERRVVTVTGGWDDQAKRLVPGSVSLSGLGRGVAPRTLAGKAGDPGYLSVAAAPGGEHFATAGYDRVVSIWDAKDGRPVATWDKQDRPIWVVAYSPDGTHLASATAEWSNDHNDFLGGAVKLWDVTAGKCVADCPGPERGILALAFSQDGKTLAGGGSDRDVFLWGIPNGELLDRVPGNMSNIHGLAYSPDGRRLAAGSGRWDESSRRFAEGLVQIWDTGTRAGTHQFQGHTDAVYHLAFAPDGDVLVTGGQDGDIREWDLAFRHGQLTYREHRGIVYSAIPSPDGAVVASGGADGTVRVWRAATGQTLFQDHEHRDEVGGVAWRPDGRQFATTSKNGTVFLRNPTGRVEVRLGGPTQGVLRVAFSPDGKSVAACSDDRTVWVWDTATGAVRRTLTGHTDAVLAVAFHPDGKWLASGGRERVVRLWDWAAGQFVREFRHGGEVRAVAFSPDGRLLATAGTDQVVVVWDVDSGVPIRTLWGHESWVVDVAFSPDGHRLVSAGSDRTVRVWSPATGVEILTLRAHDGHVHRVAFDRSGTRLYTAGQDGTAKVWRSGPVP